MFIEEYRNCSCHLATHVEFKWEPKIMVAMYWQGLQPQIFTGLSYSCVPTLEGCHICGILDRGEFEKSTLLGSLH